jgi:ATP-binding cassette subfamily C (CFTR/MRP) protein 1
MAEATASPILIDGVSLNTVDHTILRERVFSASQDAVSLPDGSSFQANLDPWGAASTAECTVVLYNLDLANVVEAKGGLEAPASVAELSAGQKQLFGLARVVLRRLVKIRETRIGEGCSSWTRSRRARMLRRSGE